MPIPSSPPALSTRPFVFVNMGMTMDAKIATANGTVSSFGSQKDLQHLYELRATSDAIMSGARTLDRHPVTLGSGGDRFVSRRKRNHLQPHALRIVVSGSGSIDLNAEVFKHRFSPILLLTSTACPAAQLDALRHKVDAVHISDGPHIEWQSALHWLSATWGVKRLLSEGGGALNGALFQAGVVDELHLTLCPRLIGGRSSPSIADAPIPTPLNQAYPLRLHSVRRHQDELFLVYQRA